MPLWLLLTCLQTLLSFGMEGRTPADDHFGTCSVRGFSEKAKYLHPSTPFHGPVQEAFIAPPGNANKTGNGIWLLFEAPIADTLWQTRYFAVTVCLTAALFAYFLVRVRTHQRTLRKYEHAKQERRLAELELEAVKAHINPHFIYNCLNSIQYFNYEKQHELSGRYLDLFAKLIRFTIQYSQQAFISVKEETTYLDNYLQMEQMRFTERLRYRIDIAENVDEQHMIPAMLIQPYVENALKHGIAPRKEGGHVAVRIMQPEADMLEITVEDDGKGFAPEPGTDKHSLGLRLSGSRARTYNQLFGTDIRIHIHNKKDLDPGKSGTIIQIKIPVIA